MPRRIRIRTAGALALAVVVWTGISALRAGVFRGPDPMPGHVRHAMVLDGQGPSGERAMEGLRMLREGRTDTLVLSGVEIGGGFFYSMLWVRMLPLSGAERDRVVELRSSCTSTQDEARLAASVFTGDDTVLVVTSAFHAWRAASIFRGRAGSGTVFRVHAVGDGVWDRGWSDREARKMRFLEWTKRIFWVLWEQWLPVRGDPAWHEFVRGHELGRFPPPAWIP
ncbi:MAG TPA: ElyC/SanA/YdcF family protein [Fibrobacteria bacterium]|nr:ElyC/SanA/YdcF family protein [Fibrobacteria bacterium]